MYAEAIIIGSGSVLFLLITIPIGVLIFKRIKRYRKKKKLMEDRGYTLFWL